MMKRSSKGSATIFQTDIMATKARCANRLSVVSRWRFLSVGKAEITVCTTLG